MSNTTGNPNKIIEQIKIEALSDVNIFNLPQAVHNKSNERLVISGKWSETKIKLLPLNRRLATVQSFNIQNRDQNSGQLPGQLPKVVAPSKSRVLANACSNVGGPVKDEQQIIFDPITNTRILYKVVHPEDLKKVGSNHIVICNDPKESCLKGVIKADTTKDTPVATEKSPQVNQNVVKVTRSGRAIKIPKHIREDPNSITANTRKKKVLEVLTCLQCHDRFRGSRKLQHHYEKYPTHKPVNTHTSLFECLLRIVNKEEAEEKTNIFIKQLEQLIEKLKELLPCMLKKINGNEGKPCSINEDLGRLFGMSPGNYNINVNALNCVKDKDRKCKHNTSKILIKSTALDKQTHPWPLKHKEEVAALHDDYQDCARTNSVDKWPSFNKRLWKCNQTAFRENRSKNKHLKVVHNTGSSTFNENFSTIQINDSAPNTFTKINVPSPIELISQHDDNTNTLPTTLDTEMVPEDVQPAFHSANFQISSTPMKFTCFNSSQQTENKKESSTNDIKEHLKTVSSENFENKVSTQGTTFSAHSVDINGMLKELENVNENTNQANLEMLESNVNDTLNEDFSVYCQENTNSSSKTLVEDSRMMQPKYMESHHFSNSTMLDKMSDLPMDDSSNNNLVRPYLRQSDSLLPGHEPPVAGHMASIRQSVLQQFLDPLGNDCFSDSELRTSSLDLPLDLFSFHNT